MENDKLQECIDKINIASEEFNESVDKIVSKYSTDLDNLMLDLKQSVTDTEAIATDTLERYYAELSNLVYFMCDKVEKLNVFSDMSKANYKETYNKAYLQACDEKDEKGKSIRTVAENTSLAENESQYSAVVNIIYDHAYKNLKMRVDMAMEMISTLKHILKRRVQEEYLNNQMANMKTNFQIDED